MSDRPTDKQLQSYAEMDSRTQFVVDISVITCIAVECVRLRKQFAAAKAVCDASKRHHNRDYHNAPKWADNCSLCRAHKVFDAAMKEAKP